MKKVIFALMFIALSLILAACGGGDSAEEGNPSEGTESNGVSTTVDITATNWEFDQENYTVPAGEVTFNLTNEEGLHGIQVDGTDVNIEGDESGKVTLEPGEYTIRCSIPCGQGHANMQSTLTVE
ncbi:cytochrome C oxidase subunit II [Virgibacillus sp. DJP39]|uniref:cytochrome C oxidase subunit II n=1 Tax=Virgibacillus sp. DJP39 TaxID=3409790 RepID=UPI003BB53575